MADTTKRLYQRSSSALNPARADVGGVCACGGDIWLVKPSQIVYCGVCGKPWKPAEVEQKRP